MSVVGDGVFKMYRYLDGTLRQFAMQKADFPHFVSHAWLSADLLVCGTVNGRLVVMDSTDVKREYVVFPDTPPPDAATSHFTSVYMHDQRTSLPRNNNEPSSRGRRDDMPPRRWQLDSRRIYVRPRTGQQFTQRRGVVVSGVRQ